MSAPELEALVEEFLRKRFTATPGQGLAAQALVETRLERAVVQYDAIELTLTDCQGAVTETVRLIWQRKPVIAEKGATAEFPPAPQDSKTRDVFLVAIGKARR